MPDVPVRERKTTADFTPEAITVAKYLYEVDGYTPEVVGWILGTTPDVITEVLGIEPPTPPSPKRKTIIIEGTDFDVQITEG